MALDINLDGIDDELVRRGIHPSVIAALSGAVPAAQPAADPRVSFVQPGTRDYNLRTGATSQPTPPVSFMGPKPDPAAPDIQPQPPNVNPVSFVNPGAPAKPASIGGPPAGNPADPMVKGAPPVSFVKRLDDEQAREQKIASTPAPQLHGFKKLLDIAGQIVAPGIESRIQGTPGNFRAAQAGAIGESRERQAGIAKEASVADTESQANQRNAMATAAGQKDEQALAKIGMKRDESGAIVPDENSEIYKGQQSKIQTAEATQKGLSNLRQAQAELAQARTEVELAKNDPNSPAYKQAQQKLQMAQRAHDIAAQNLGLHQAEFANRVQEQELIKPSGQSQSRGSAAQAVLDLIPDLEKNVRANAKEMGPTMGRLNRGEIAIGNVSPDVAKLYSAMKSFYALQPAVHGFRNAEFVKDFETALGTLERDPEAFIAGMQGLKPTLESVAREGKTSHRRIVEGRDTPAPAASGGGFKVPDGAPAAPKEDDKLLKMNGAVVAKSKGGQWVAP
jgi:hypothetical protein